MRMIQKSMIPVLLLALLQACSSPGRENTPTGRYTEGCVYARGFRIKRYRDFSILHVMDPWQGSSGIQFRYVLASDPGTIPDSLGHLVKIQTPVSRVICMSTTHVAMIDALGMTQHRSHSSVPPAGSCAPCESASDTTFIDFGKGEG